MKTLGIKLALSAVAVAVLVATPAFARSHRVVYRDNAAALNYVTAAPGSDIPAYNSEGDVIGINNPDQYGLQSQR
jgi:hypothetical protein